MQTLEEMYEAPIYKVYIPEKCIIGAHLNISAHSIDIVYYRFDGDHSRYNVIGAHSK